MHTIHLVYCVINNFIELFSEYYTFIRHYWGEKINIRCEVVTSHCEVVTPQSY